jgi:multiple sugar transport system permease protein/raffinose/stachyose/melibiose transport system permease protein
MATATRVSTPALPRARSRQHGPPWAVIVLFLLPAAILYLGFTVYPTLMTFYNSVNTLKPGQAVTYQFVGLQHYVNLLTNDDVFYLAALHSLTWAAVSLVLEVPIAFVLALILASKVKGARFFRTAWFTPVLIAYPIIAVLWLWIFNYDWGVINVILRGVGLGSLATAWLGNPVTALPSLILVTTWMFVGFDMVILLAAIHAIPGEITEAAQIDGATRFQVITRITIPLLRQTIANLLILCFIGKMKQFALVYVMTRGGPLWATETVATYVIKRAFAWQTIDLGYPSAIAVLWFAIILGLTLLFGKLLYAREAIEY